MLKVRMLTTAAGPAWAAARGQIIFLPDAEAAALIKGGYAQAVGQAPAASDGMPATPKPAAEDTASRPTPEEATPQPAAGKSSPATPVQKSKGKPGRRR